MKIKYIGNIPFKGFEESFFEEFGYCIQKENIKNISFKDKETYYIVFNTFQAKGLTRHFEEKISKKKIESFGKRLIALMQRPYFVIEAMAWNGLAIYQPVSNIFKAEFYGLKEAFNPKENEFIGEICLDEYILAISKKYDSFFPMLKDYLENYHKIMEERRLNKSE